MFSEDIISKTKEFLSYDINFQNTYNYIVEYYNKNINPLFQGNIENTEKNNIFVNEQTTNEQVEENQIVTNEQIEQNVEVLNEATQNTTQNNLVGIGGGTDENIIEETIQTSADEEQVEETPLTQMEIDANDIKQNYSFILPLRGTISSRYGPREPTEIVSANHAGIDIAVNEGTVFIAAMAGKVTDVILSSTGYGNHVYIENGDVITLYAHCKTIYVKEGDTINQGQKVGEVGETGNATGPHLHFEIRKNGRVVNPEYVLSFE